MLPVGDPWLSAGLLKDGDPIYLVKWETEWPLPQLLHIQSIKDVELFGIDGSNYGNFVIDRPAWEARYGIDAAGLQRGVLASAVPATTPTPTPVPPAPGENCRNRTDFHRPNWPYDRGTPQALRWTTTEDTVNSREPTLDHHVALKDAFLSGGCLWSRAQKAEFSNDAFNHFWTARSFNSSKGFRTPDQLTGIAKRIINTAAEQCAYAMRHNEVKKRWSLTMTAEEAKVVNDWLLLC